MTPANPCPPRDLFDLLTQISDIDDQAEAAERRIAEWSARLESLKHDRAALEEQARPALTGIDLEAVLPVSRNHCFIIQGWADDLRLVRHSIISPLNRRIGPRPAPTQAHQYDPDDSGVCRCENCEEFRQSQSDPFAMKGSVPDRRTDHVV